MLKSAIVKQKKGAEMKYRVFNYGNLVTVIVANSRIDAVKKAFKLFRKSESVRIDLVRC